MLSVPFSLDRFRIVRLFNVIKYGCFALSIAVGFWFASSATALQDQAETSETERYYLPLAKSGDVEAQYLLGLGYERGLSGAVDRRAAARWYRLAAEAGHNKAAYRLALLLLRGDSIPEDTKQAVKFFEQAGAAAHPEALYYLGYMNERGLGISSNERAALGYYEQSAQLGLTAAMKAAASLLVRRSDQHRNLPRAWHWLYRAAFSGDIEAIDMKEKLESMMSADQLEEAKTLVPSKNDD